MSLKGAAAITGYAEFPPTKTPDGLVSLEIIARLARETAQDAGFEKRDIDVCSEKRASASLFIRFATARGMTLGAESTVRGAATARHLASSESFER